ncbi:MAG TPA: hypothetical protein VFE05_15120 [Longimicrobiaceae bacterium]|jgi:hypothetical protein|nr:hypothetical protein [Longimicrobiaceae bacterium]
MFKQSSGAEFEEQSEGGTRYLFSLDHFDFTDALGDGGAMRHFVVHTGATEDDASYFEADQATMYEFMARYLAGEYEKNEYGMTRSPAHEALLDTLEIAAARARAGESDFALDDLDVSDELDEAGWDDEDAGGAGISDGEGERTA